MENTPNHNYNVPSEGTTNWHIPLNENFEQIDIDIEIRGTESDKKIMNRRKEPNLKQLILERYTMAMVMHGYSLIAN